jgi:uncharacterized protein (TIGR00288 family)
MLEVLKKMFNKDKPGIALLVDGPNMLRKQHSLDLGKIRKEVQKYGVIRSAKVYLDQFASDKLIEAIVNQGFETEITTGDVDVTMAIEAMEYTLDKNIDILALMTRDTDYRPLLIKARAKGKKTIIIATDIAFSVALKNTADIIILFKKEDLVEHLLNQ